MKDNAVILNNGGHWSRYITSVNLFFKSGLSWNSISSGDICVRYFDEGFIFASASMCGYGDNINTVIALLNSTVSKDILKALAPTMNYGPQQVKQIPYITKTLMTLLFAKTSPSLAKIGTPTKPPGTSRLTPYWL